MLLMLIDNFQVSPDKGIEYEINELKTKDNTGLIIACLLNNIQIVKILLQKFSATIVE